MSSLTRRDAVLALGALGAAGPAAAAPLAVGDVAPDFTLPASSGGTVSLSQFRGKKNVVLAFFPKAFTGG